MRHALLALLIATGPALAAPRNCLLEVDGRAYVIGRCNVEPGLDGKRDQDFSLGTGDRRTASPFFAYVTVDPDKPGVADGQWSGPERGSTHAHSSLGALRKNGACWENERARVCVWQP